MAINRVSSAGEMIQGEINRICVTDQLAELEMMTLYAMENIMKLYTARKKELRIKAFKGTEYEDLLCDKE